MKVYLSGRMSGLSPDTWRWRFATWDVLLEQQGYKVVNPADTLIARHPWLYRIIGYRRTLWYDLQLLKRCDLFTMVGSDWQQSRGARLERLKAREWGVIEVNLCGRFPIYTGDTHCHNGRMESSIEKPASGNGDKPTAPKRTAGFFKKGLIMNREKLEHRIVGIATGMIISFLIIIFLCMCSSCTTTKVVTVEKVRIDTLLSYSSIRDSIYLHDSTFIREKGDTVLIERWHTKYIDRTVHDTLYKSKTDSIPVPVPVTEYVKRELTWWQQTRLHIANILLWALLIVGIVWIIKKKFLP